MILRANSRGFGAKFTNLHIQMITAQQVKELRQRTGVGMLACKNALAEANGDLEAAIQLLRERGQAKAGKKADRETGEGAIGLSGGAMVKLLCETDFVARNEKYIALVKELAEKAAAGGQEAAKAHWESVQTDFMQEMGENLQLADVTVLDGETVSGYVHNNGKIGVLVALSGGTTDQARDVAMHAAAMDPLVANPEDVPSDVIEAEKEIYREQMQNEGKPADIIDKIIAGKVNKFCAERALTSQTFVKDPSTTVQGFLGDAKVTSFVRFSI